MTAELVAGRYRLGELIGTGGMGRVWLATDEVLRRNVAIKEVLLPDSLTETESQELRLRTLREARAAARLAHPNVIRIYDVLYAGQRPWIVMEYIHGRSLAHVIKESGPLTPARAARMGLSICAALSAAHTAGVLHRDVKPGNVLLGEEGRVVLTDFGLATYDEIGVALTQPGVIHGSPQFIAPERAQDGTSSPAADMWSLGATLYAAVEGHSPYARPTSMATLTALATAPPDPPRQAGTLKPVLLGLLRRNPRARMKPDEVMTRLQRIVARNGGSALRVAPRQRRGSQVPAGSPDATVIPQAEGLGEASAATAAAAEVLAAAPGRIDSRPDDPPPADSRLSDSPQADSPQADTAPAGSVPAASTPDTSTPDTSAAYPASPPPAWPPFRTALSYKSLSPRNRRTFEPAPAPTAWPAEDLAPGGPMIAGRPAVGDGPPVIYPEKAGKPTTSEFDSVPFPYGAPTRPRRRIGPWVRTTIVVLPLLLIGTIIWVQVASRARPGSSVTTPTPSAVALAATWPCPPGPPGASAAASPVPESTRLLRGRGLPSGWTPYFDPSGFQMAVPSGWVMSRSDTTVCFHDPNSDRTLGVYVWPPPDPDPVAALRSEETRLVANGKLPEYQRLSLVRVPRLGCAEWQYTYQGSTGRLHVIVQDNVAATGRAYAFSWLTTDFDWTTNLSNYYLISASFEPPSP